MSILTLVKAGAVRTAMNVLAGGGKLGDAIRMIKSQHTGRITIRDSYETFRNIARRAQRQLAAGARLQAGQATIPVRALPTAPATQDAKAGTIEYETIVVVDRGDGSKEMRKRVTVTTRVELSPSEIRYEAMETLHDDLLNDRTSGRSGIATADVRNEAMVDVIIMAARVRESV